MAKTKTKPVENLAPFVEAFAQLTVEPPTKEKKKVGKPSSYNIETARVICERLSNGESLVQITNDDHMPVQSVVYMWLLRHEEFTEMYTRAREEQADTNADQILAIADEMPPEYTDEKGRTTLDPTYIAWQKQRIEARKWTAMKLKPRKYGDKMQIGGDPDNPEKLGMTMFDALLKNVELKLQAKNG